MAEVHKRFGKLPWADLFEESAQIAEDGFEIYKYLGDAIEDKENWLQMPEYGWEAYLNEDGTIKKEGDIIKQSFKIKQIQFNIICSNKLFEKLKLKDPKLANTLRRIAQDPDNFYNGELAEDIASDLAQVGSWINITDLNIYDVNITEPLKSDFDGKEFYFPKAQASGPILQLMLNILDGYELNKENHLTEVGLHLIDNPFH